MVDVEKAFAYVDHQFFINVLDTFGFDKILVTWIKILLKSQEPCLINREIITKYVKLESDARQGDPISAYIFILVLEEAFSVIKSNQNIDKLRIFEHNILYTAYIYDTTFFVKNICNRSFEDFGQIFKHFWSETE